MSLSVAAILGEGGALASAIDGYEHRPEQLTMAAAVEKAFAGRGYLLAEAGTGTGKTLAYLVPAVLSGRKVVISTATKTLQEQIFRKDVPLLREKLGLEFTAAYLKGRSNYLCQHRYNAFLDAPRFASREEAELWPSLERWAQVTPTGDRAELELPEGFSAWPLLTSTSESCLGTRCPLYESCFVTRTRREAEGADVIVVNHHLFFADLAIKSGGGPKAEGVLPRYDAVVFDEAHAIEDAATEYFGHQVSNRRVEELCDDAMGLLDDRDGRRGMIQALALKLRGDADGLFKGIHTTLRLGSEGAQALKPLTLANVSGRLHEVVGSLSALHGFCADEAEPELLAIARRAGEVAEQLEFIGAAASADYVYWADARGRGVFLHAAPIEVGNELHRRLYGAVDTVVFTSATLTAERRFDYFARRMGLTGALDGPLLKVSVDSPFDYRTQAAVYLPEHLPEPHEPGFVEAVAEEVRTLVEITEGRAFILFTSLRNMEAAHAILKDALPYQVLLQGELPKQTLLDRFQREPSVLFAAHSFWEGVDVPGEALSLVVIDKLPFAAPNDPLVAARIDQLKERGEDAFGNYQLPQAAIALRQGFGRLIRTGTDRGIVAILDKRIRTKRYGRAFIRSLPNAPQFEAVASLQAWFNGAA